MKLFGTDGIRGEAGVAPLDAVSLRSIGLALSRVLARDLHHPARLVIGRDTRESGPAILAALSLGLVEGGASVRSAGVVPTPAISLLARSSEFDAGIMVSASHNPHRDNGLKIFASTGMKLADDLEAEVETELDRVRASAGARPIPSPFEPPPDEELLRGRHSAWLRERATALGGLAGMRLVIDCAHGAWSGLAAPVLRDAGADVTSINESPDGRNINERCGSTHPESLAEAVRAHGADAGVAFDGDADRALFCDATGRTVDGDDALLILADALSRAGELRGGGVVGTIMSNFGLEQALRTRGLALVRERVGDRAVLERMLRDGYCLGGEPSGHVIVLDDAPTGDGMLTALRVFAAVRASGLGLGELADLLPRTPQILRNVKVRERMPLDAVDGHAARVAAWTDRLGESGRIVIRYSGTEPLVRVMAEGNDAALVGACVNDIASHLEQSLGSPNTR